MERARQRDIDALAANALDAVAPQRAERAERRLSESAREQEPAAAGHGIDAVVRVHGVGRLVDALRSGLAVQRAVRPRRDGQERSRQCTQAAEQAPAGRHRAGGASLELRRFRAGSEREHMPPIGDAVPVVEMRVVRIVVARAQVRRAAAAPVRRSETVRQRVVGVHREPSGGASSNRQQHAVVALCPIGHVRIERAVILPHGGIRQIDRTALVHELGHTGLERGRRAGGVAGAVREDVAVHVSGNGHGGIGVIERRRLEDIRGVAAHVAGRDDPARRELALDRDVPQVDVGRFHVVVQTQIRPECREHHVRTGCRRREDVRLRRTHERVVQPAGRVVDADLVAPRRRIRGVEVELPVHEVERSPIRCANRRPSATGRIPREARTGTDVGPHGILARLGRESRVARIIQAGRRVLVHRALDALLEAGEVEVVDRIVGNLLREKRLPP